MKKLLTIFLLLTITLTIKAQEIMKMPNKQISYLKKSRVQKGVGYSMLGLGALFIIANSVWNSDVKNEPGLFLFPKTNMGYVIGGGLVGGSIPLLASGSNNKKKGMQVSTALKLEHRKDPFKGTGKHNYPAVAIALNL